MAGKELEMLMGSDSWPQRWRIFFPQLPTETRCLNQNDMAAEQECAAKGGGFVGLEGSIGSLCRGVLGWSHPWGWKSRVPLQDLQHSGVPVPPQSSSVGRRGIKDVKTRSNVALCCL